MAHSVAEGPAAARAAVAGAGSSLGASQQPTGSAAMGPAACAYGFGLQGQSLSLIRGAGLAAAGLAVLSMCHLA